MTTFDWAALIESLDNAQERYETAKENEQRARGSATDALNELNRYQKEFDEACRVRKTESPPSSDWKQEP